MRSKRWNAKLRMLKLVPCTPPIYDKRSKLVIMSGSVSEDEKDSEKIVKEITRLVNSQESDVNRVIDAIHQVRKSQERFSWIIILLTIMNVGFVYMTLLILGGFAWWVVSVSGGVWAVSLVIAIIALYRKMERLGEEEDEEKSRKAPILVK